MPPIHVIVADKPVELKTYAFYKQPGAEPDGSIFLDPLSSYTLRSIDQHRADISDYVDDALWVSFAEVYKALEAGGLRLEETA